MMILLRWSYRLFFESFTRVEKILAICFILLFSFSSWVYIYESLKLESSLPPRDSQRLAYDSLCPDIWERPAVPYDFYWAAQEGLINLSASDVVILNSCVSS